MLNYILRRLLLMIPTLFGIMIINFVIIQFAPGGPVEQAIAEWEGHAVDATSRFAGTGSDTNNVASSDQGGSSKYRGGQGLRPEIIAQIEKQFGFDKPAHERFFLMMWNYIRFDFGESYFSDKRVSDLVIEKLPVSISLGLWSTLIIYCISIPMGIRKAVRDNSRFGIWTSAIIVAGYAIPGFLFAILLIVVFAGGQYLDWFPLRGLTSENFDELSAWGQVKDYFWHITLPVIAMSVAGFATITLLTKNSFLEEIRKQYVLTAKAKGLTRDQVLYGHVFRNAILIVVAGFPGAFVRAFFAGSIFVETVFSLDGLGLLALESITDRDYPVILGSLFIFGLMGLVLKLVTDILYVLVDPRIDFARREG